MADYEPELGVMLKHRHKRFYNDIDFQTYKAIAMTCDNGSAFPTSPAPATGQWFLLDVTGRKVLFQYNGSSWTPIMSLGAITIYVDPSGSDGQTSGTATGASAFATVQYACNQLPPLIAGNVSFNIGAGTYSESVTLDNKTFTGGYTFTIQGEETAGTTINLTGGAASSTTAQGTMQGAVADLAGIVQGDIITGVAGGNAGRYFTVYSTDGGDPTTTLTLTGHGSNGPTFAVAAFTAGDTMAKLPMTTIIQAFTLGRNMPQVTINGIHFNNTTAIAFTHNSGGAQTTYNRCRFESTTSTFAYSQGGYDRDLFYWCVFKSAGTTAAYNSQPHNFTLFNGCQVIRGASGATGLRIQQRSWLQLRCGSCVGGSYTNAIVLGGDSLMDMGTTNDGCWIIGATTGLSGTPDMGTVLNYAGLNFSGTSTNSTAMVTMATTGVMQMTGSRLEMSQGTDVASANNLTLGTGGNVFEITGTTQINLISVTNWQNGSEVTLLFTSTPTVKNGQTTSGANTTILLSGAVDLVAAAGQTLTLKLGEIGGTQAWREIARTTPEVTAANTVTLTNKTLTSPTIGGTVTLTESTSLALDPALSADGTWTGITRTGTAGATLAFGDLCYLDPTDNRWELADANAASGADGDSRGVLGICVLAAAADGSATNMLLYGNVQAATAFPAITVNAPYYVSETAGDITGTQPTTTDAVIRVVGFGLAADEILFNPSPDYITHT